MMQGGVWSGLGRSPFVADVMPDERSARRLAVGIVAGLAVGFVAGGAALILILSAYTLFSGHGREGLAGLGRMALLVGDVRPADPATNLLRVAVTTLVNFVFMIAFVATIAALSARALIRYVTTAPRIRWRLFFTGLVLAGVVLTPAALLNRAGEPSPIPILAAAPGLPGRAIYVIVNLLLIPAAWAEEVLFRGFLLRVFAGFSRRPSVLLIGSAVIFSSMHLDPSLTGFVTRVVMGVGLAYMTLRIGGTELSAGAHAANNLMIVFLLEPLTQAATTASGPFDLSGLVANGVVFLGYVAIAEAVARIEPLRRLAGVEPRELSPSARSAAPT